MKSICFRITGRFGPKAWASCLLSGLLLAPFAVRGTIPLYSNSGTISGIPPNIDATAFYNSGLWDIVVRPFPYTTANTLNYTNVGTMISRGGWEFDFGPLPGGGRGWSANFVNNSSAATVQAQDYYGVTYLNQLPPLVSHLWVSATNIVNKGELLGSVNGEIVLTGNNVNLSRSAVATLPVVGQGSPNVGTNFTQDTAVYSTSWKQNASIIFDSSILWDVLPGFLYLPSYTVDEPCGVTNITDTMFIQPANLTVASTNLYLFLNPNNQFLQAVFVGTSDPNIKADIRFLYPGNLTNFFQTIVVRLSMVATNVATMVAETNFIYIMDDFASSTNNFLAVSTNFDAFYSCGGPAFRPGNFVVSRSEPTDPVSGLPVFAYGLPGSNMVPDDFFFHLDYTNTVVQASYSANSNYVQYLVSSPGTAVTNLPGRVKISANNLNLNLARLRGEGDIVVQASNLTSSVGAIVDCPNASFNLGATNGQLNFTNMAGLTTFSRRLHGGINAVSVIWSNYNSFQIPGPTPITGYRYFNYNILVVDATSLSSQTPMNVRDFALHSTNMTVGDNMMVNNSFLFDGQSLTLLGELEFSGAVQDWLGTDAPRLLNFTNKGFLQIPNNAHFGDDTAAPYSEFVNQGVGSSNALSGVIVSAGQAIRSQDIQIINGINVAFSGDFSATAQTMKIVGPPSYSYLYSIYSAADINLTADTLLIDPAVLYANGALNLTVTNSLSDNGAANSFTCYNGFNLWLKPQTGDLLGTTVTSIALNGGEVDSWWAGEDRGATLAGYTNNAALGTLVLSAQVDSSHSPALKPYSLFFLSGAGPGNNALYVNTLDLSQLSANPADIANMIQLDSNMKIYFHSVIFNFTPPGGVSPEAYLTSLFPGQIIKAPNIVTAQTGVVDWNTVNQRIDGFGGGVVFLNPASMDPVTDANMDTLFGTTNANQLGLTLIRVYVDETTNWANALLDGQKAVARGARILATPWTPPTVFKSNNNPVGGSFNAAKRFDYANYLNSFANYMSAGGALLAAISIQNEPDATVTYQSCSWSADDIYYFFNTLATFYPGFHFNVPVMIPESENFNQALSDETLNDPSTASYVSIIGGHLYGNGNAGAPVVDYPLAHSLGKPTWMTEFLINDQTISTAMMTAQQIQNCLTVGNMSAYIWWKSLGDANGLVNASGVPQKRGFVMAQFSRFIRPGYYRVGFNNSGSTLSASAFTDSGHSNFVIVAVNNTPNYDVAQTFTFTNFTATSVTPWITSAGQSLAVQPPVAVSAGSFTYTVPAQSVVTFVGQAASVVPHAVPLLGPGQPAFSSINASGPGGQIQLAVTGTAGQNYTLLTSTNLVDWQPLYTTNPPSMPLTLLITNNTRDHARYYRLQAGQ